MQHWTEDRARTYFENGGEAEHEITQWLREQDLLRVEGAFRYAFDSLHAVKAKMSAELEKVDKDSPHAANLAVGGLMSSLGRLDLNDTGKAKLRSAVKVLCGLEVAPAAPLPALVGMGGGAAPTGATPKDGGAQKRVPPPPSGAAIAHTLPGAMPIPQGKKVLLCAMDDEPSLNNKVAEVMVGEGMPAFDDPGSGGKYCVKLMHGVAGQGVTGRAQNDASTLRFVLPRQLLLHPDQIEKDRLAGSENAIVLLGGDEAEREARAALYSLRLEPQHWYDAAVERILAARHEFEVLGLPPRWCGGELSTIKRAYRRTSASVHPDKNSHPQAVDAFRKVYGAFETLLDLKQQWRLLFVLGKLVGDETSLYELEAEEEERFEWWWQANVPEMERQAAEAEGSEFEAIGEQWISDGKGDRVDDVTWVGLAEALRLHEDKRAIFLDCRERWEYSLEHVPGAHAVPMREFVDLGLMGVSGEWVSEILRTKNADPPVPIIIYSEVATPFSRCRALSRWLLRAGHSGSISAARLRRLRGGLFGWKHKKGPTQLALTYVSPEERARLKAAEFTNVGHLTPRSAGGFNLRVRVEKQGAAAGVPNRAILCDSSGRVLLELPPSGKALTTIEEAARSQGALLVRGAEVRMEGRRLRVALGPEAKVEVPTGVQLVFGLLAPFVSDKEWPMDDGEDDDADGGDIGGGKQQKEPPVEASHVN
jgi:rhodanese-related sulfurtransferase